MQTVDFTSVAEWLTDGARSATRVNQFISEACERLVACGLPLSPWPTRATVRICSTE